VEQRRRGSTTNSIQMLSESKVIVSLDPKGLEMAQTQRLAAQLQSALETRGVIDRAIGIMMSRSGGTEDQALPS
jgi:AmiR/NasT family two-component response regulator